MARYSSEHKQATRQRIIERAGHRFKRDGIDGSGIAALMSDASLTNGAFYAHFRSKEDLVCAVLTDQLGTQREAYGGRPFTRESFERFVRAYLSPEHAANREDGCPSSTLLIDVDRLGEDARHTYTVGLLPIIDDVAALIPAPDARARAASLFASMIGTLQLARAIDDHDLAAATLGHGVTGVLTLIDMHCTATNTDDASRNGIRGTSPQTDAPKR